MYKESGAEFKRLFGNNGYGSKPLQSFNVSAEPHILLAILQKIEEQNELLVKILEKTEVKEKQIVEETKKETKKK